MGFRAQISRRELPTVLAHSFSMCNLEGKAHVLSEVCSSQNESNKSRLIECMNHQQSRGFLTARFAQGCTVYICVCVNSVKVETESRNRGGRQPHS